MTSITILCRVHAVFYTASIGLRPVALAALALSTLGVIAGSVLSHYHQIPTLFEATDAVSKYFGTSPDAMLGYFLECIQ